MLSAAMPAIPFGMFDHVDRGADRRVARDLRAELERHQTTSGCTYVVGRFVHGDLGYERASRSLELFAAEVMPHFRTAGTSGARPNLR